MKNRLLLFGALALAPTLHAQKVFAVLDEGSPKMVKEIRFNQPLIEKNGKLTTASSDQFTFLNATVYRPGLVTMSDFRVGTSHIEMSGGGQLNWELHIRGHAKSDTTFKKCFMVLEMTAWKTKGVTYAEMPDLPAGESANLNLTFRLADKLEEGSYRLHLFSDGIELLHTKLPEAYVTQQKMKTEAFLSGKTQDWPPLLAHRVNPVYPEELKKSKTVGAVSVRLHVTKNGDVESPTIVKASNPLFAEATLAAVVKWKFDPALKGRKFADANIEVPVVFTPPK